MSNHKGIHLADVFVSLGDGFHQMTDRLYVQPKDQHATFWEYVRSVACQRLLRCHALISGIHPILLPDQMEGIGGTFSDSWWHEPNTTRAADQSSAQS
nr:hypothetical protein [Planctopirus limnophila]